MECDPDVFEQLITFGGLNKRGTCFDTMRTELCACKSVCTPYIMMNGMRHSLVVHGL